LHAPRHERDDEKRPAPVMARRLHGKRGDMLDKLDFILRFWDLKARHGAQAAVGALLTAAEQVELLSLINLMSTDHPLPEPGPAPRVERPVPLQLSGEGGGFLAAELRMVCAGGLLVACASPLRPGQRTVVRLADAVAGVEYTLPCSVEWVFGGGPVVVALRCDGAPARVSFALPEPSSWRVLAPSWNDPPWAHLPK
jgi:hypothetical protein